MSVAVGVDVVDRTDPRAQGRASDERFLHRVFCEQERERIRSARDPDLEVWVLWAAKEAAFKVVSKLMPAPPVFSHRAFRVADPPGAGPTRLVYESLTVQLGTDVGRDRVLVWGWNGTRPEILVARCRVPDAMREFEVTEPLDEWISHRFTAEECDPIHGVSSALVRLLARRDASRMLRLPEHRLSILSPPGHAGVRPPYLFGDGERLPDVDVSLSHDGGELAWAVRVG